MGEIWDASILDLIFSGDDLANKKLLQSLYQIEALVKEDGVEQGGNVSR